MKIFLIFKGFCQEDVTWNCPALEDTKRKYAPYFLFVEAPDYVFEGWGFDETKEGDERFVKPTPPDGWLYDDETGTFYEEGSTPPSEPEPTAEELINIMLGVSE